MAVTAILGDAGILEVANFVDLPTDNASDTKGRLCFVTATGRQYRDNGTTWVEEFTFPKPASLNSSYISDLAEFCRDTIGAALVAGTRVSITVNDAGDTITIASDDASTAEFVRDTIGTALVAGTGVSVTVNDAGDTITIASTITQYTDEMVDDRVAALLVAGTNITLTYNDVANTLTIAASGGGSGGHIIEDDAGTDMTARGHLQFKVGSSGATLTDDSGNDRTILDLSSIAGGGKASLRPVGSVVAAGGETTMTITLPSSVTGGDLVGQWSGRLNHTTYANLQIALNGDTATNWELAAAFNGIASGTDLTAQATPAILYADGTDTRASAFHANVVDFVIPDCLGTLFYKAVQFQSNRSGSQRLTKDGTFIWPSTAAVTSVQLRASLGSFVAGSRFDLYIRDPTNSGPLVSPNPELVLSPPKIADGWTWINQGDATVVETAMGLTVNAPANASNQHRLLIKTLPAAPYKITTKVKGLPLTNNYESYGIGLRQSSDGKEVNFAISTGGLLVYQKHSGPTGGFVANYTTVGQEGIPEFLQIEDDLTNRHVRVSSDGVSGWRLIYSVARTDYLTPDQFFFYVGPPLATYNNEATLLHYTTDPTPVISPAANHLGGAMVALHDEVLTVDTLTLTYSPPTSGYRDLIVAIDGRTDEALGYSPMSMRFNGDTGANYDNFIWEANSGGAANNNAYAATAADAGYLSGNTAPAGTRSKFRVEIADYLSTTFNKQATTRADVKQGTSGALLTTATRESWWRNSAAITSLTFLPTTSGKKFLTGTRFTVWGIKAS
jgi:hypothetical protein